jgi:hypothetical protein
MDLIKIMNLFLAQNGHKNSAIFGKCTTIIEIILKYGFFNNGAFIFSSESTKNIL